MVCLFVIFIHIDASDQTARVCCIRSLSSSSVCRLCRPFSGFGRVGGGFRMGWGKAVHVSPPASIQFSIN